MEKYCVMRDFVNYMTLKWSDFLSSKPMTSDWSSVSHSLMNSRHFDKCSAALGSFFLR